MRMRTPLSVCGFVGHLTFLSIWSVRIELLDIILPVIIRLGLYTNLFLLFANYLNTFCIRMQSSHFFLFGYVLYNNNLPYGSQSLNCGDVSFVPVPSSGAYSPRPNNQLFLEAEVMSFSCDARGGNGCIYFLVLFSLFALRYKMLLFRSEAHTR